MGARDYCFTKYGTDPKKIINEFKENEVFENGNSSGFLRKSGLVKVDIPEKIRKSKNQNEIYAYIDKLAENDKYSDKYGPFFYVEIPNFKKVPDKEVSGFVYENIEVQGKKSWQTVYKLYGDNQIHEKSSKTEAMKLAKELAKKGLTIDIEISKKLVISGAKSNVSLNKIAKVKPKYKDVNKLVNLYIFFGWVAE